MDKQLLVQQLLVAYRGINTKEARTESVVVAQPVADAESVAVAEPVNTVMEKKEKEVIQNKLEYNVKKKCFPMISKYKIWIFPEFHAEYEKLSSSVNRCRTILQQEIDGMNLTGFLNRLQHEPNILCLDRLRLNSSDLLKDLLALTKHIGDINNQRHNLQKLFGFFNNYFDPNKTQLLPDCHDSLKRHGYNTSLLYDDLYAGLTQKEQALFDKLIKDYQTKSNNECKDFKTRADLIAANDTNKTVSDELTVENESLKKQLQKLREENATLTEKNERLQKKLDDAIASNEKVAPPELGSS